MTAKKRLHVLSFAAFAPFAFIVMAGPFLIPW